MKKYASVEVRGQRQQMSKRGKYRCQQVKKQRGLHQARL